MRRDHPSRETARADRIPPLPALLRLSQRLPARPERASELDGIAPGSHHMSDKNNSADGCWHRTVDSVYAWMARGREWLLSILHASFPRHAMLLWLRILSEFQPGCEVEGAALTKQNLPGRKQNFLAAVSENVRCANSFIPSLANFPANPESKKL